jgi:hypothetical protein
MSQDGPVTFDSGYAEHSGIDAMCHLRPERLQQSCVSDVNANQASAAGALGIRLSMPDRPAPWDLSPLQPLLVHTHVFGTERLLCLRTGTATRLRVAIALRKIHSD